MGHWMIEEEIFEENFPREGEEFFSWLERLDTFLTAKYGEKGVEWHYGTRPEVWFASHRKVADYRHLRRMVEDALRKQSRLDILLDVAEKLHIL